MRQPDKEMRPGGATPEPQCIALQAIAQSLYAIRLDTGNPKGEWLAIPRPVVELAIDLLIDWLDLMSPRFLRITFFHNPPKLRDF